LNDALAARFPGITATEYGLRIEPEAAAYMKDWPQ
jgi:hypothetical protein